MRNLFIISAILILSVFRVSAQTIIPVKDAANYAGKKITTCDKVFSIKVDKGNIILCLGGDSPDQFLTAVIKSSDRKNFRGKPELDFKGKDVCVTGKVTRENGKPQIILSSSKQIHAIMMDNPIKQKSSFN